MLLKLNKYDIILTIIVSLIAFILLGYILFADNQNNETKAVVYFQNQRVHEFDLNDKSQEFFEIEATNGLIVIEKKDGKVRVINETSRNNICSIQGWSNSRINPIVCLPNHLYVRIESSVEEDLDVIVQ
jgi:hypothetical protein